MKYGSLFSGAGLGDFGFELAGLECAWQVEIDDYCQKILELRWPNVRKFRDIKTLDPKDLEEVDLITGGFPCQDISQANPNAKGLNGERSGLWREMYRILVEVRPRFIVVENTAALTFRGLGRILGDLAKVGYYCQWFMFPSSFLGAPHQRERVWILANTDKDRLFHSLPSRCFEERERIKTAFWGKYWDEVRAGYTGNDPVSDFEEAKTDGSNRPWLRRVVNGDSTTLDRLKALGNGQTPCSTYVIGKWIMEVEKCTD